MSVKPALLHFKFDNFAALPSDVGCVVKAGNQTDRNLHRWDLWLYPGGDTSSANQEGWISLYLCSKNAASILTRYSISVKDANGAIICERDDKYSFGKKKIRGHTKFIERATILDATRNILKDGVLSLHIDVTVQVIDNKDDLYQPPNDISDKMLNLLYSGKMADISFNVQGQIFRAHSQILYSNAPILANYCDENSDVMISIEDTTPEVFHLVLKYVYSGLLPSNENIMEMGKELIDTANRYELVNMKMAVENVMVGEKILNKKNVADYILFSDAQSCPLLKEYAISFFLLHAREVLNSSHSKNLREAAELLSEIIMMMMHGRDEETTTVTELRKQLNKRGLDVDGSKQALVSRLEDSKRKMTD